MAGPMTSEGATASRTLRSDWQGRSFCGPARARVVDAAAVGQDRDGIAVALRTRRVVPGGVLLARLLNRGDKRATYGPFFRIHRYVFGKWRIDPASPKTFPKVLRLLSPGRAGRCFRFAAPEDLSPGKYRFLTFVKVQGHRSRRMVEFRVEADQSVDSGRLRG